jgi:hypothetical protein
MGGSLVPRILDAEWMEGYGMPRKTANRYRYRDRDRDRLPPLLQRSVLPIPDFDSDSDAANTKRTCYRPDPLDGSIVYDIMIFK